MKVLQINSVCGMGSTGRIATDLHNVLIENEHESYIAYGRDLPRNCDETIRIGTDLDNYKHVVITRLYDKHGFGSKKATKMFIKQIEELNPDIIHLHNIHGYYINIELLFNYLKKVDIPVIWTLHDCWAFTGHCTHFDFIKCDKWKTGCYHCPQKNTYPSSLFLDKSKRNYSLKKEIFTGVNNMTIVTPSKWLASLVEHSFLSEYPIEVINNGIDLNVFKPTTSHFRKYYNLEKKFVILGVASVWEEKKGFNYFIDLSNRLETDEVIILVGLPKKLIKKLPANIIGITRTNNVHELVSIYSTADVFVNPTLEDNFPTTNLEALACGTPVITFNTGGSRESIDESCGIIVEKDKFHDLINIIKDFKLNKFSSIDCVQRSKRYDSKVKYNEYLDIYIRVLINHTDQT